MRFDSSVSFVSFENVEYGFVEAIDESLYRNVSLVFELSKKRVIIRNVRILIQKIDMCGPSFFTALFDVLQRMPPTFERTVHYETDVVF